MEDVGENRECQRELAEYLGVDEDYLFSYDGENRECQKEDDTSKSDLKRQLEESQRELREYKEKVADFVKDLIVG